MTIASKLKRIIGGLAVVYFLIYLGLTLNGRYQPIAVGAANVKEWAWSPWGFYDADHAWPNSSYAHKHPNEKTGGWKNSMMLVFFPLWEIDTRFVHTEALTPHPID
jgi:hypothetical protein